MTVTTLNRQVPTVKILPPHYLHPHYLLPLARLAEAIIYCRYIQHMKPYPPSLSKAQEITQKVAMYLANRYETLQYSRKQGLQINDESPKPEIYSFKQESVFRRDSSSNV